MASKRGPYAKTDGRRRELGRAALALVQEKGHRQVAVAEVADRAGVSEPTVFYHFPTKDHLLIAALEQFDDEHIRPEGLEAGAIADMGRRAEKGVRRRHIPQLYAETVGASVDPEHPANGYVRARQERSMRVIATDIRLLQDLGMVPGGLDAVAAARTLLAAWEGLQLQWLQGPAFDIRAQIEWNIEHLLGANALEPHQRPGEPEPSS